MTEFSPHSMKLRMDNQLTTDLDILPNYIDTGQDLINSYIPESNDVIESRTDKLCDYLEDTFLNIVNSPSESVNINKLIQLRMKRGSGKTYLVKKFQERNPDLKVAFVVDTYSYARDLWYRGYKEVFAFESWRSWLGRKFDVLFIECNDVFYSNTSLTLIADMVVELQTTGIK